MEASEWVKKLKSEGLNNLEFKHKPFWDDQYFEIKFSKLRSFSIYINLDDWTGGTTFNISCEGGAKRVCSYLKSKFENKNKHGKGIWWQGPVPGATEDEKYQWVSEFLKDFNFILDVIYKK